MKPDPNKVTTQFDQDGDDEPVSFEYLNNVSLQSISARDDQTGQCVTRQESKSSLEASNNRHRNRVIVHRANADL